MGYFVLASSKMPKHVVVCPVSRCIFHINTHVASLVAQMVKNLPAMQETQDRSLGHEDPPKKGMQSTPVFLPGESHGQRSLVGYTPWGCKKSDMTQRLNAHTHINTHEL